MDIKTLSQIDPSIVDYPEDLTEKDQDVPSTTRRMVDLFVIDSISSAHQPIQSSKGNIVLDNIPPSSLLVTKEYVYEVSALRAFLEEMKKNSFNPYLDIVPRHHFRYSTQVVGKSTQIYDEYVHVLFSFHG